jgi:hypothetical protein
MSADVGRLLDLEAIKALKALKARYCRGVDTEDWETFRGVFVASSEFDADAFVARVVKHHTDAQVISIHECFMPEITFTSEDTATGIWAMEDWIDRIWHDDGTRESWRGHGWYHESYRRVDGEWKIAGTRHERIRIDWLDSASLPPLPQRGDPGTTARGGGPSTTPRA